MSFASIREMTSVDKDIHADNTDVVEAVNVAAVKEVGLAEYYRSSGRASHNVRLEWKDIEYRIVFKDSITKKYQEKVVLDGVSGHAESGQLLAILGPSGCGKTSLMNILAAKLPAGGSEFQSLSGSITLNGKLRDEEQFRSGSSYVLQDDFMYPHLTVLEVLTLASHFYCANSIDDEEKAKLVNAVIMELGLVKAKDTLIGNDRVRGVSGGERKRCNIGIQLLTDPAILFLDEPTTGLDSFQALAVMQCIKGLADNGRLVVAVIHQPRSQIYSMFDQMMLLSTGKAIYFGDAASGVDYFAKAGHPCPAEFNPADHYLDVLSIDGRSAELRDASNRRIQALAQLWKESIAKRGDPESEALEDGRMRTNTTLMRGLQIGHNDSCESFFAQLRILCWRTKTEVIRDWFTLVIGCVILTFLGFVVGGVYSNLGNDQISIQNRNGLLFFIGVNCTFNGLFSVLNVFPKEKNIVNVERSNRAYSLTPYFLAKFFVEIPARVVPAFLYGIIVYLVVGLRPERFGMFLVIVVSAAVSAIALGLLISAVMPTFEAAIGTGPLIVVVMILFGGLYIDINSLPEVANLVPYVSIIRWSFHCLAINEYQGTTFTCEPGKKCLATGEQVLDSLGFGGESVGYPLSRMWLVTLFLTVAAYLVLLRSKAEYSPASFTGSKYEAKIREVIQDASDHVGTAGVQMVPLDEPVDGDAVTEKMHHG